VLKEWPPPVLEFRALKAESSTVDKRSRVHFECCRHLPVGAEVQFLLADLSAVVRPEIADQFAPQLEDWLRKDDDDDERLTDADFPALGHVQPPPVKVNSWAKVMAPPPAKSLSSEAEFMFFSTVLTAGSGSWKKNALGCKPPT
jgi:hypothetical protein